MAKKYLNHLKRSSTTQRTISEEPIRKDTERIQVELSLPLIQIKKLKQITTGYGAYRQITSLERAHHAWKIIKKQTPPTNFRNEKGIIVVPPFDAPKKIEIVGKKAYVWFIRHLE